jgi:hypothetical protein
VTRHLEILIYVAPQYQTLLLLTQETAPRQAQSQPPSSCSIEWNLPLVKLTTALTFFTAVSALVFGVSVWDGMDYAINYAAKGYWLGLWQAFHDQDVRPRNTS